MEAVIVAGLLYIFLVSISLLGVAFKSFGGRARELDAFFARTLQAFADSDPAVARDVIDRTRQFGKQAEKSIRDLTHGSLPTADTVCLVLAIRFMKRIAMHLNNVATTVVVPIDNLDFWDEKGQGE